MCTVSVIRPLTGAPSLQPGSALLRVVVNRDEQRTRPAAFPPVVVSAPGGRAVMPLDPQGGGTWVAANDAGLVFALLNGAPAAPSAAGLRPTSRGLIIPRVVESSSVEEVWARLQELDVTGCQPWRLIVASSTRLLDVEQRAGRGLRRLISLLPVRFMATSSSERSDDAGVARRRLFRDLVAPATGSAQDRFHAHQWDDDPGISVVMQRESARTVSRTVIEVCDSSLLLAYSPLPDVIDAEGVPQPAVRMIALVDRMQRGAA
jgi:hypothetical protein